MAGAPGPHLARILAKKSAEVAELKSRVDRRDLKRRAEDVPPARDFKAALRDCPRVPIIAEIKKASPSAGTIKSGVDVGRLAQEYQAGGAAALSVLTDGPFFGGSLADLTEAREAVNLPVLCKDFLIDPLQLYQARIAGADAVLLIVAALEPVQLAELFYEALELGLTPLVEVHREEETATALSLNPPLIGLNNRDLTTLEVSLDACIKLRPLVTNGALVVAESGVNEPADIARLRAAGLDAFLVGTALMRAADPKALLAALSRSGS